MLDVEIMVIDELRRRWPDMDDAERARRVEMMLPKMRAIAVEFERVSRDMKTVGIGQLQRTLDALKGIL